MNSNKDKLKKYIYMLPNFMIIFIKAIYVSCNLFYTYITQKNERKKILKTYKDRIKWREKKTSYGNENKDKKFFIIRRVSQAEGHFSMINTFLGHLEKADRKDYIPVVDMQNYYSPIWQAENRKNKENAWEYFYEQPCGYTLDDIANSKNIVLSHGFYPNNSPSYNNIISNKNHIDKWNNLYVKYIKLNSRTSMYIEEFIKFYQIETRRVLAVSIRRGIEWGHMINYPAFSCYSQHPSLENVIFKTKELLELWNCDYIFLSIDDQEGLEIYKKTFGDRLLYIERERSVYFRNGRTLTVEERREIINNNAFNPRTQENIYDREVKFLSEIHIISRCKCIICANTSANATAFIINGNKYENTFVFDKISK